MKHWYIRVQLWWRTYCPVCQKHIKKNHWLKLNDDISGHYRCVCINCNAVSEKYTTLDECGFGRRIQLISNPAHDDFHDKYNTLAKKFGYSVQMEVDGEYLVASWTDEDTIRLHVKYIPEGRLS